MAKHVKMMTLDTCPHCKNAFEMMDALIRKHPEYSAVEIEVIEETKQPEKIVGYDYYYVPTFFVDDVKIMEGVPSVAMVEQVYIEALK